MTALDADPSSPRRRWVAAAGLAVAVVVILGGANWWLGSTGAPDASAANAPPPQQAVAATRDAPQVARTCREIQPLTVRELARLAAQPALPPVAMGPSSPAREHLRSMIRTMAASP